MKKNKKKKNARTISFDDNRLLVETISKIEELKGAMNEFKEQITERLQRLEVKEADRWKNNVSVFSIIIAAVAVITNIIVNIFKH